MITNTETVKKLPHWMSVGQYAEASGIQVRAVRHRIQRKVLCAVRIDGMWVIDTSISAPAKVLPYKPEKALAIPWPPDVPKAEQLTRVSTFCERNNVRGHALYTEILSGNRPAFVFAGHVFIENLPELSIYRKPRRKTRPLRG